MTDQQIHAARALADQIIRREAGHVLVGQNGEVRRQALMRVLPGIQDADEGVEAADVVGRLVGAVSLSSTPRWSPSVQGNGYPRVQVEPIPVMW